MVWVQSIGDACTIILSVIIVRLCKLSIIHSLSGRRRVTQQSMWMAQSKDDAKLIDENLEGKITLVMASGRSPCRYVVQGQALEIVRNVTNCRLDSFGNLYQSMCSSWLSLAISRCCLSVYSYKRARQAGPSTVDNLWPTEA